MDAEKPVLKAQGLKLGNDKRGTLFITTAHKLAPLSFKDKLYIVRAWAVWFWRTF